MFHNLLLKLKKSVSFFLYFIMLGHKALAEITISFPSNRIVFQRNNDNKGFVNIIGKHINEDKNTIYENVKKEYGIIAEENPVALYNYNRLYKS